MPLALHYLGSKWRKSMQHLIAAQTATINSLLFCFFPEGESNRLFMFPHHINYLSSSGKKQQFLIHNTNISNNPLIKIKQTHKTILLDLLKPSPFGYCSHSPASHLIKNEQIKEHFTYSRYTRFSLTERIS